MSSKSVSENCWPPNLIIRLRGKNGMEKEGEIEEWRRRQSTLDRATKDECGRKKLGAKKRKFLPSPGWCQKISRFDQFELSLFGLNIKRGVSGKKLFSSVPSFFYQILWGLCRNLTEFSPFRVGMKYTHAERPGLVDREKSLLGKRPKEESPSVSLVVGSLDLEKKKKKAPWILIRRKRAKGEARSGGSTVLHAVRWHKCCSDDDKCIILMANDQTTRPECANGTKAEK